MFILNDRDVQHCRVNYKIAGTTKNVMAIKYYGDLFVKVSSYATEQFQDAVAQCRYYLDLHESVASIVIKEATGYSVWCKDESLDLISEQNLSVSLQSLALVEKPESASSKKPLVLLTIASILLCL